ncbi:LysM peptidoglycan-binding domain-containing protein [Tabrizicola sp.]|uniref:LysM peptidoglycan-binding domain-containing protein n=1 Tax=Tabrizicola sp. TaxID=2005166 RepID=UPI003F2FB5E5
MKNASKKHRLAVLTVALLALPAMASAQEACTTYTVKDGDTLGSIAQTAYGTFDYQMIFNANRDALAASPNSLPAGLELILPCEDGRLTADSELSSVIDAETEKQEATATKNNIYEPPLKFVTANGFAPFTDESLTGGGIMNRLAMTALQRGGNDREATLSWVDDWGAHLDPLLPTGAMDVSVAWMMPDCSKMDLLGEFSLLRCTQFDKSLPIYEMAFSYITLNDNKYANVPTFRDLEGARICRPKDYELEMLEIEGLVEPFITMVLLPSLADCAQAVVDGEVDVYVDGTETGIRLFEDLGVGDRIAVNPYLVQFPTFHFIVAKNNPRGRVYLAMINRGLTEMRESGEWYDIVASGLAEFNELSQ